ncbi:MAG: hypothetical protein HUU08_02175 [Candidatus Brocadia sp.]|nr:hypothetical protein [Candidatus Brocadia sp.]
MLVTDNQQRTSPLHGYALIFLHLIAGLAIGCLIIFDPYGTTCLNHLAGIKLLPFTFSLLIFAIVVALFFLVKYLGKNIAKILENKELLFVIFYIAGYQTSALQLGIVDASDLALGVFLLVVLIDAFVKEKKNFINTPINLLNLLLLVFILLPLVNLRLPSRTQFVYTKVILMFFLMTNCLYSKKLVIKGVKWLIIITSCSAVFAIFQEFMWITTGTLVIGMIPKSELKRMFESGLFRVPAFMLSYRMLAILLSSTLIITISFLVFPNPLVTGIKKRLFLYVASFAMFAALLLTMAKDVLLGFFVALMLLLIMRKRRYIFHSAVVILLLIIIMLTLLAYLPGKGDTISYIVRDIPKIERERIQLNRDGIQGFLWSDYKLSGRGKGGKYTDNFLGWPAHNAFILILDEAGIFGFIIYLSMYIWALFRLICLNLVVKDPVYLPVVKGLLCGIIIYFIGAQFIAAYVEPFLWVLFALTESTALILANKQVPFHRTGNIMIDNDFSVR